MAKIDLCHAYRTVHIHPNNYQAMIGGSSLSGPTQPMSSGGTLGLFRMLGPRLLPNFHPFLSDFVNKLEG